MYLYCNINNMCIRKYTNFNISGFIPCKEEDCVEYIIFRWFYKNKTPYALSQKFITTKDKIIFSSHQWNWIVAYDRNKWFYNHIDLDNASTPIVLSNEDIPDRVGVEKMEHSLWVEYILAFK